MRYADWKAPKQDGETLLWPALDALIADASATHDRLGLADVLVQETPLSELRRTARQFLGIDDATPLFVTGHQAELHHPGVWAKNAIIHAAANQTGGEALHVVVDTDTPKHLLLRWPAHEPGGVGMDEPITDDPGLATAKWSGALQPPTPAHVAKLQRRLAESASDWKHQPMLAEVLEQLAPVEQDTTFAPGGLPAVLASATHNLDWDLGLRYSMLTLSPMLESPAWLALVHHLARNAEKLRADYNAALANYRRQEEITDPQRPMPDLAPGELPLWLDDLDRGTRRRAQLSEGRLIIDGDVFEFGDGDAESAGRALVMFLRRHRRRLSPRALSLTLFLRLFVADNFVHGIGGGRYDQVADRLIASFFGIEPPRFSVATATLMWPGVGEIERVCPSCIKQRLHRAEHAILETPTIKSQADFAAYHRQRWAAADADESIRRIRQALREAPMRQRWESSVTSRELFYPLQPRERLESLLSVFA
ncbi:MAG: hypothetical protein AAGD32_16600 [Planctomycetota bacterium]